jgi:DNA invertase Pin-like site-specific DNA recombinase
MARWAPKDFDQAVAELCAAAVAEAQEREYQRRSQRICASKALRRRRGEHQGGNRPFGWTVTRTPVGTTKLVPVPAEQKAIRDILRMRIEGRSLMMIRDEMRRRGHTRLSHETVRQICFRNGAAGSEFISRGASAAGRPWHQPSRKVRRHGETGPGSAA